MTEKRLYHQAILDAAAAQTGRGVLEHADASVSLDNPLCGDRVRIDVALEGTRLRKVRHEVRGCLLCEAAASVIGAEAPGEPVEVVRGVVNGLRARLEDASLKIPGSWAALEMFAPVANYKSRHDCVMLPFDALIKALDACEKN